MEWKKSRGGFTGSRVADLRSVKITDQDGHLRRFRICTLREPSGKFTRIPAEARLFKSEKGYIGVIITGKYGGYVKVGKNLTVQQCLSVSLSSISKKPLKELLKETSVEITEIDGTIVGIER